MAVKKFGVGQALRRVEDQRLLIGGGHYMADFNFERQLQGFVLRSPHAHARIRGIDRTKALAVPGVNGAASARSTSVGRPVSCASSPVSGRNAPATGTQASPSGGSSGIER